jgi:hypothetical protein
MDEDRVQCPAGSHARPKTAGEQIEPDNFQALPVQRPGGVYVTGGTGPVKVHPSGGRRQSALHSVAGGWANRPGDQARLQAIAVRTERRAMKNRLPPNVPVAIAIFAAVAVVALWAAARQPGATGVPRTGPALVTATAEDNQPQPTVTVGMDRPAGQEMAKPPGTPDWPDGSAEQMRYVFHELHAEGHHAQCGVCATRTGAEGTSR